MKRTTARAPWVDNRPFKNTATKHNKYANDKRKQHFEDASFKIFFPKIRVVLHKVRDGITKCRLIKSFYSVAKVARPDFITLITTDAITATRTAYLYGAPNFIHDLLRVSSA